MMKRSAILTLVAVLAVAAGFGLQAYLAERQQTAATDLRPDFTLVDGDGNSHNIGEWDGKVILLNFWAAWCPPCKEEIPDFVRLQEDFGAQGFVVVGVAIDTPENAQAFMDTVGVNYPVLMAQEAGIPLAQQYGNRLGALPYSVIIDRQGHIVSTHVAKIDYQKVARIIRPLLQ